MAEKRVREALLLEAVTEAQELTATDEEVEARLVEMAEAQGMDVDTLRPMAEQQGWLPALQHELVEKKAYAWLAEQATIEDIEPELAVDEAEPAEEGDGSD